MRGAIAVFLLSLALQFDALAVADESVEVHFPRAELANPRDEHSLAQRRRRPVSLRCEFVNFDIRSMMSLIEKIEAGIVSVEETSVTVYLFDQNSARFAGFDYEANRERPEPGPFAWYGRSRDDPYFVATFIIHGKNRAMVHIDSIDGVFRLSPSHWSESYYLCELDPNQLPRKID